MNTTNIIAAQPLDLDRYDIDCEGLPFKDKGGVWVAYEDAAALIAQVRAAQPAGAADTTVSTPQYENVVDHNGKIVGVRMANADQMPIYADTTVSASIDVERRYCHTCDMDVSKACGDKGCGTEARATLAPVSAQQGAAEQQGAVECDSALRAEPAGQHDSNGAA